MVRRAGLLLLVTFLGWGASAGEGLEHRVWLLSGVPSTDELASLRQAGVDALVVPVGTLRVQQKDSQFTVAPLPEVGPLSGWTVSVLVWAEGSGRDDGGADSFVGQLAPVDRLLTGSGSIILAARRFWDGLPQFASSVARHTGRRVEIAVPVGDVLGRVPEGGWPRVTVTAVAFGLPTVLGFPASTFFDDQSALDQLDRSRTRFRVAVVTGYHVDPPPPPGHGLSLESLTRPNVASFRAGARGDAFVMQRPVVWGGLSLAVGQTVEVQALDASQYHRSLGLILRTARAGLLGWDSAGLPAPHPTIGMSREGFLAYFHGAPPRARPEVDLETTAAGIRVTVRNPTPFGSAVATTGNYVELRLAGGEIRDVQTGDFSGVEYGRFESGTWRATVAREATSVRFFMTMLAPGGQVSGGTVLFFTPPRAVDVRWGLRDPDGGSRTGKSPPGAIRPL